MCIVYPSFIHFIYSFYSWNNSIIITGAKAHHSVRAPLGDEGMGLILWHHSLNQWHIVTDALQHEGGERGFCFILLVCEKKILISIHEKWAEERLNLNKEGLEVTEVFEHVERTWIQLSFPLLHFLLRQTHWMGLLNTNTQNYKHRYRTSLLQVKAGTSLLFIYVKVKQYNVSFVSAPWVTGRVSVQSYWSFLPRPSAPFHQWWRPGPLHLYHHNTTRTVHTGSGLTCTFAQCLHVSTCSLSRLKSFRNKM